MLFLAAFFALMISVEMSNGKFWTNDLKVYYLATSDYFSGQNPYEHAYGLSSGYFKYPPTTLIFFSPLASLPFFWAQLFHSFVLYIACVLSIVLTWKNFYRPNVSIKRSVGILYLLFVFIAVHIVREVHLGNLNLILLCLFLLGLVAFQRKKKLIFILFWSVMVIIKPIVFIAFIPLGIFMMWKEIARMIGFGILFLLLPFVFTGQVALELWHNWINAVSEHGNYIVSENSLTYLFKYYLNIRSNWLPSFAVLGGLLVFLFIERKKIENETDRFVSWSAVFLAFSPNFFVTDTEHFLLSLPMIVLLMRRISIYQSWWYWIPFSILMIFYALKSNDLWGPKLGQLYTELGLLGLANLGLIIYFILLRHFDVKSAQTKMER